MREQYRAILSYISKHSHDHTTLTNTLITVSGNLQTLLQRFSQYIQASHLVLWGPISVFPSTGKRNRVFCHKYHRPSTHPRLPDTSNFQLEDAPELFFLFGKCTPDHFDASKEAKEAREAGRLMVCYCLYGSYDFSLLRSLPDFLGFFTRFSLRLISFCPNFSFFKSFTQEHVERTCYRHSKVANEWSELPVHAA